jgi:hypothetical protein
MFNSVVVALYCIAGALVFLMLKQGLSRKVDLFSARNMYLVGFIIYQLTSPAVALQTENFTFFRVYFPSDTGKQFLMMASTFITIFLFSYQRIGLTPWAASKLKFPPRETNDFLLLGLAVFLVVSGMLLRFMPIPNIAAASVQVSIAFAAIAAAISGWVWSNRRSNIPVAIVAGMVVSASLGIALAGIFGRRPLLAVVMGFAWGVYHRRARLMSPGKMILYIAPFMAAATITVAAFTAARTHDFSGKSDASGAVTGMMQANIKEGIRDLLSGQACGSASLWAIEQWPDHFEQRFLFSLKYMGMYFVPRFMWPEKPEPLGNDIARLADVEGVNQGGITIPPGVVGYAVAEGGYWAIVIYALFFGQFLRFIDELVRLNPTNSFIILPAAVATGQAFGLARGCIAVFADLIVLGFVSTYLILFIADRLFGKKIPQVQMNPWPQMR